MALSNIASNHEGQLMSRESKMEMHQFIRFLFDAHGYGNNLSATCRDLNAKGKDIQLTTLRNWAFSRNTGRYMELILEFSEAFDVSTDFLIRGFLGRLRIQDLNEYLVRVSETKEITQEQLTKVTPKRNMDNHDDRNSNWTARKMSCFIQEHVQREYHHRFLKLVQGFALKSNLLHNYG
jgi:hypothetical protein